MDGIPVKEAINYLGVVVSKSEQGRVSLNFNPALEKIKSNLWLRELSLRGSPVKRGRDFQINIASSIHLDNKTIKTIKCKFSNKKPYFSVFLIEFKNYFSTIQSSTNAKANKTVHLCTVFKIFD